MSKIDEIRKWDDESIVNQLRNPMRESLGVDAYLPLIAEALARLLERESGKDRNNG